MSRLVLLAALVCVFTSPNVALADLVYAENPGDLGTDLSDTHSAPTSVGTLPLGEGTVAGIIENADRNDVDIFTFKVDTNQQLDSIQLFVGGERHFLALAAGTQISSGDISTMLMARLISDTDQNDNLLYDVPPPLAGGITTPIGHSLAAGDYTIWLQELNFENFDYEFTFQTSAVTAIPEPSSVFVLGLLGMTLTLRRRR
ncbi:MAG: PEP-CTERM sorting domain-containing protein [Planctomycetales bacterium]|nr:PEP-CTERM sorting domain-containing protein [Planctomycetales bacterium]